MLAKVGADLGLPPESVAKIEDVRSAGLSALETLADAGVLMAYGTDLLGDMHPYQSDEFTLRAQYLPAMEAIRPATIYAAQALGYDGKIGSVAPGTFADLIVVDGDPLKDIALLTRQGQHTPAIMKDGVFEKDLLAQA